MFLKNVSKIFLKVDSIALRLIIFYTITAFILLAVVALFSYWQMSDILYKANYQFLSEEVDEVQNTLRNNPFDLDELQEVVINEPRQSYSSIDRYFIRVLDAQGKIVLQTPGMDQVIPPNSALPLLANNLDFKKYSRKRHHGAQYLVAEAKVQFGAAKQLGQTQIALDISHQHALTNDRSRLVLSLLIGAIAAFLLGVFIARRFIKSLRGITEAAEKITATSLNQRIDPNSWPKELVKVGEAFNNMLERIENAFLRLTQFSADLSHELRTPINNLIGTTEIALSHQQPPDEYRRVLESNLEELNRLSQMVENILFLARVENPQLSIEKQSFHLSAEINLVCEYYQAVLEEKNLNLIVAGDVVLSANRIMMRRMISNLISNAINYTLPGGKIILSIERLNEQQVQISVTDTGVGIAREHLSKIFDRFYRVDTARSHYSGGTGLGLAIVRSIVILHHGTIVINSVLGQGTTINITLPI